MSGQAVVRRLGRGMDVFHRVHRDDEHSYQRPGTRDVLRDTKPVRAVKRAVYVEHERPDRSTVRRTVVYCASLSINIGRHRPSVVAVGETGGKPCDSMRQAARRTIVANSATTERWWFIGEGDGGSIR